MKLTFSQKTQISLILNSYKPILIDNKLYTHFDNTIVITDTVDGKILDRISFDKISCFTVKNQTLYVAHTEIILYCLTTKVIRETLSFNGLTINEIVVDNDIYISCIDGTVKKIMNNFAVQLTTFENTVKQLLISKDRLIAHDGTTIKVLYGSKVEFGYSQENIKGVAHSENVYFVTGDGKLFSNDKLVLNTGLELDGLFIENGRLVLSGDSKLYVYSLELTLLKTNDLIDEAYEEGCGLEVAFVSKDFIVTLINEIFLLSNDFTVKNLLIGNIDEITSMKRTEDFIVIASSSDRLVYTYKDYFGEGEYALGGFLLAGHSNVVMSIDIRGDKMLTTSRDCSAILWEFKKIEDDVDKRLKIEKKNRHCFTILNTFDCENNSQNTGGIASKFFVVGGDGGIIKFFNLNENFITKKIHTKEINALLVCDERKVVITASQDKEIKVFDYNCKLLHTLTGHRKGVIALCLGNQYLASCSLDKTIRLWDVESWECVGVLEGHESGVLSCAFYKNYLISASLTGVVKFWNLSNKRCENNVKFPGKVWTMSVFKDELLVGSSDFLYILADETQKKSLEVLLKETNKAKQKIAVDACLKNNNYKDLIDLLKDTKDHKMLFNAIRKVEIGVETLKNLSKQQLYKVLNNNQRFKNGLVNNKILQYLIETKQFASKEIMKEIEKRSLKEFEALDTIYRRFMAFDYFINRS